MSRPDVDPVAVTEFDEAPVADAAAELMPCCASRRWVSALVAGRPYGRLEKLEEASDALLARLPMADLQQAMAGLPRLDRQLPAVEFHDYERRFELPFITSASGVSESELLASLRSRSRNDPVAEREIVRAELARIVRRRLRLAFA